MHAKLLAFQLGEQYLIPICLLVLSDHIWYSILSCTFKTLQTNGHVFRENYLHSGRNLHL